MKTIRCSRLPLAMACPQSTAPAALPLDGDTAPANLGTAFHAVALSRIAGRALDIDEVAERNQCDPDELARLAGMFHTQWARAALPLTNIQIEPKMDAVEDRHVTITGTPDIVADTPTGRAVIDLKSGWLDGNHRDQLRGYAWLVYHMTDAREIWCGIHRVRRGEIEGWTETAASLDRWYTALVARVHSQEYNPGPHCGHCPRRFECSARREYLRDVVAVFAGQDWRVDEEILSLRTQAWVDVLGRIKLLQAEIDRARETIKADVIAHGGLMPGLHADLQMVEEQRESIQADIAFGLLMDGYFAPRRDVLLEQLSISKAALERAVKKLAPKGEAARTMRDLLSGLREAGAMTETTIQKLEVVRHDD